jgi:hypothetical protein
MMDKAALQGLAFRRDLDPEVPDKPPLISDSYSEFMSGAYKALTLGRRYYRPVGPEPIPVSATQMRENINETIDASVFERWRVDNAYRPRNLTDWAARRKVDLNAIKTSLMADTASEVA